MPGPDLIIEQDLLQDGRVFDVLVALTVRPQEPAPERMALTDHAQFQVVITCYSEMAHGDLKHLGDVFVVPKDEAPYDTEGEWRITVAAPRDDERFELTYALPWFHTMVGRAHEALQ